MYQDHVTSWKYRLHWISNGNLFISWRFWHSTAPPMPCVKSMFWLRMSTIIIWQHHKHASKQECWKIRKTLITWSLFKVSCLPCFLFLFTYIYFIYFISIKHMIKHVIFFSVFIEPLEMEFTHYPNRQNFRKTVWRSVFLTIYHCILSADSTKTYSASFTF